MPETIGGLPVHPLVVHAVVVLVPLAVLLILASLASRTVRRRAGLTTPILATVALAFVPLATESGEQLEHQISRSALVRAHAELGDTLLPWVAGVAVAAWALWWFTRNERLPDQDERRRRGGRWLLAVAVLALVTSIGTAVQVVRIGDSGARAVWQQSVQPAQPSGSGDGDD